MKILFSCKRYTPIRDMMLSLKWLSVENLLNKLIFIFEIKTGTAPQYLINWISYNCGHYQYAIFYSVCYKKAMRNTIFHNGLRLFNNLSVVIKNSSNSNAFKSNLKIIALFSILVFNCHSFILYACNFLKF